MDGASLLQLLRIKEPGEPRPIRLHGRDDLLLFGTIGAGGPIGTKEQYDRFEVSYAHLLPSGEIMQFGKVIGHRNEIEFKEGE